MKKESDYQSGLISRLKETIFPGSIVLKNDSEYIQGIPDLTIFYNNKWATLEVKRSDKEHHQPNQDYYVDKMNSMSFSAFIYPENEQQVISRLSKYFCS